MARSVKIVVALLCIACILAFCIAPYAEIPATALRSLQAMLLFILALAAAATLRPAGRLHRVAAVPFALRTAHADPPCPLLPPFQTGCVLQC